MNALEEARLVMDGLKGSKLSRSSIKLEEGYLYLMTETGRKYTKIGISIDPNRRRSELDKPRTKMPYDVHLLRKVKVADYKMTEKVLHAIYKDYRIEDGGEWFDLDPLEVTCLMLLSQQQLEDVTNGKVKIGTKGSLKGLLGGFMDFLENPTSSYEEKEVSRQAKVINDLSRLVDQLRDEKTELEKEVSRLKIEGITGMKRTEDKVRAALRSLKPSVKQEEPVISEDVDEAMSDDEYRQQCSVCWEMDTARFTSIDEPDIQEHPEFYIYENRFHSDKYSMLICESCNSLFSQ